MESESHFLLYCTNYEDLRELLFHEITRLNPEIFWCSDEQKLERLMYLSLLTLSQELGKEGKIDCLISIYLDISVIYGKLLIVN